MGVLEASTLSWRAQAEGPRPASPGLSRSCLSKAVWVQLPGAALCLLPSPRATHKCHLEGGKEPQFMPSAMWRPPHCTPPAVLPMADPQDGLWVNLCVSAGRSFSVSTWDRRPCIQVSTAGQRVLLRRLPGWTEPPGLPVLGTLSGAATVETAPELSGACSVVAGGCPAAGPRWECAVRAPHSRPETHPGVAGSEPRPQAVLLGGVGAACTVLCPTQGARAAAPGRSRTRSQGRPQHRDATGLGTLGQLLTPSGTGSERGGLAGGWLPLSFPRCSPQQEGGAQLGEVPVATV